MIVSFVYICFSSRHKVTLTLFFIYSLEIISQAAISATFLIAHLKDRDANTLTAISFFCSWLGLSIFTG